MASKMETSPLEDQSHGHSAMSESSPREDADKNIRQVLDGTPESERPKIEMGARNAILFIKERANRSIAEGIEWAAGKASRRGDGEQQSGSEELMDRLVFASSKKFEKDADDARRKIEDIERTGKTRYFGQAAWAGGSAMKILRTGADVFGYTAAAPLRYWTMGLAAAEQGFDILKETRLRNEKMMKDEETAAEEAWKIYEKAEAKSGKSEHQGVVGEDLEKAFREELPKSISEKLGKNLEHGVAGGISEKIFKPYIKYHVEKYNKKINEIRLDPNLSDEQKELAEEKIQNDYNRRLEDFDRLLNDFGAVDTLGMLAKYGEVGSKWAGRALMVETAYLSIDRMWHYLANAMTDSASAETLEIPQDLRALVPGIKAGVLSEKQFDDVARHINDLSEHGQKAAAQKLLDEMQTSMGGYKVGKTGATVNEILTRSFTGHETKTGSLLTGGDGTETSVSPVAPDSSHIAAATPDMSHATDIVGAKITPDSSHIADQSGASKLNPVILHDPVIKSSVGSPQSRFEEMIDNAKTTGHDSVWKATKRIFMSRADGLGYQGHSPQELDKWAETQTANAMRDYEHEHGVKIHDLVHGKNDSGMGDKVTLEIDQHGHRHISLEDTSHIKSGYLHNEVAGESGGAEHSVGEETSHHGTETASAERPSIQYSSISPEQLQDTFDGAKNPDKLEAARDYLHGYVGEIAKESGFKRGVYSKSEIDIFAHLFPLKGIAEKITDIATPEKLARALEKFDAEVRSNVQYIKGLEEGAKADLNNLPVMDKNGTVFIAEQSDGPEHKWRLIGRTLKGTERYVRNFWGRPKEMGVKELGKFLGSAK